MSWKKTLAADSARATPVVNSEMSTSSSAIGSSHWNMKYPKNRNEIESTTSSMPMVTSWAITMENTRCSWGNATFLIRLAPPCTLPIAAVTEMEKNWNGKRPERK